MKTAAFNYWQRGHRIVLLKEKMPLVKWRKWEKEPQSLQDFENLPWGEADGFAIICGVKLSSNFYVGVLDSDLEKSGVAFSEETLEKQTESLASMPVTQIEETPGGGRHLVYHSRTLVKTKTYDVCGVEILGENKLCIMAPSKGYKRLNDNLPTELESLKLKFEEAMEKAGVKTPSTPIPLRRRKRRRKEKARYCCEMVLKRDKHVAHLMRLAVASEYKKAGLSESEIVNRFRTQADFDRKKCLAQVKSADPDKVATCESIKQWGYCLPECPLREWSDDEAIDFELAAAKTIQVHPLIDFHPEIGYSLGAFLEASQKYLLIIDKKVKVVDYETLLLEGANPKPVLVKQLKWCELAKTWKKELLLLVRELKNGKEIEKEGKKETFNLVLQKALHYFYHPDQRRHLFTTCYIIATYYHRLFSIFAHYVLQGPRESGKSTMGWLLGALCWNPTKLQLGLRAAPLFRSIENSRPTYLADLTKVNYKDADLMDVYEVIEPGSAVRRCVGETNQPTDFYVHCPKVLMVRRSVPFSHKCIECITVRAPKQSPYTERRRFIKIDPDSSRIVSALLRSTISNWHLVYAAYKQIQQDEKLYGRRFDLWRPFLAVCKVYAPERYDELLKLAYEDMERAEKGDVTSDVEDTLLGYFVTCDGESKIFLLKELTEHAQKILSPQVVKSYHIVTSALKNLGVIKRKLQSSEGVKLQIDLAKAHDLAGQRSVEEESTEEETATIMFNVKTWCRNHRDDRSEILLEDLAKFIREELKQDPQRVIERAYETGILMKSPEPGKAVVM